MKTKSIKDPEYIAYVEKLPCLICGHTPKGTRKVYFEFTDNYKEYPCKNNAHHVDKDRMRRDNDHRVVSCCAHYTISGNGTKDCHRIEHSNALKTKERDTWLVEMADNYYQVYCEKKGIKDER